MLTTAQTLAFLLTALVLTLTPGPDLLMVLSMGMSKGRRAGMAFGLGCALGCLTHTALAVVGVSALLAASPLAFTLLKVAGGAYLIWLGIQALRHAGATRVQSNGAAGSESNSTDSLRRLFAKGLLANAINPKIVLFFLSFLPQFVVASQGNVDWQLGQLGLIFTAQAAVAFCLLGYFAGSVGGWLNQRPSAGKWLDRVAGVVFVGLGVRMVGGR